MALTDNGIQEVRSALNSVDCVNAWQGLITSIEEVQSVPAGADFRANVQHGQGITQNIDRAYNEILNVQSKFVSLYQDTVDYLSRQAQINAGAAIEGVRSALGDVVGVSYSN